MRQVTVSLMTIITYVDNLLFILQGLFAFHFERGVGYKIVSETFYEHEKCGLMEIDFLSFTDPWMPVQKYSPYKEIFKIKFVFQT